MSTRADLADRLWRVRKRHDHIDAVLHASPAGWELQFGRNDRPLVVWQFATEAEARREADARLKELQRAGWTSHW
ncbi:MAG TPA: hypothetical protein VLT86_20275 [Vicinamibacterales bacterium]|nr:hypothetical protein [Vicinamibacterales bacterium]